MPPTAVVQDNETNHLAVRIIMTITKGYKQLIAEARTKVRTLTLEEAKAKLDDPNVVFVDIRDVRELEREEKLDLLARNILEPAGLTNVSVVG